MASLGTNGGVVKFRGWFLLNSGVAIPDNVRLQGDWTPGAITSGNFVVSTVTSALVVNPTHSITLGNRDGVSDALVITSALAPGGSCALPFANATIAASCVAAFSGTAFVPNAASGTFNDHRLENLLVLGFNYIYQGGSISPAQVLSRPVFRSIYGDNTNGISVQNVGDTGRAEDLHMWPFTTVDLGNAGTTSLFWRTGTAFYTGPSSTWMKWDDADEFGYAVGHQVDGTNNIHQTHCGADNTGANSSVGFLYTGSISFTECDHCTVTGQGDTGFRLNATTGAGYTGILLTTPISNGNSSANGYVDVQSGNYAISNALFTDNSAIGHIKLESGAGAGAVVNPIFANNGGNPAVFGNAAAITKMQLINPTYAGTSTSQLPNYLTSASVGSGTALSLGSSGSHATLAVTDTGSSGANISLNGNGGTTPNKYIRAQNGQFQILNNAYSTVVVAVSDAGRIAPSDGVALPVTTVAGLPTCGSSQKGLMYAVSDATTPTYNGALTGGGTGSAANIPVFCNGTAWTAH
jgi:hypothetical protein